MKSQLLVCFILLAAIAVIFLAGLTVEPGPVSNIIEPTKCANGETVCSDNTEDSDSGDAASTVNVTDTTATQVRHQLQYLNDSGNHSGYVVAHYCHEQQTSALKSLFSLQCWAAQLNMPVVEPFVVKSAFQTPLENDVRDLLRFSDLYDMGQWNERFVKPNSFLPFASWEDFVQNSPRDVILVQTLDSGSNCSFPNIKERFTSFLKKHRFKIVKEVCIPLEKIKPMTTDEFNHLVLNDYYNVSVIFVTWRGVCAKEKCGSSVISVTDSKCDRMTLLDPNTSLKLNLSKRVNQDADLYVHRYLKNNSYISVMLRLEKPIVTARTKDIVSKCTKGAQDTWKRLKKENQLNMTFLAWDIGRFGSASFWRNEGRWKKYKITQNTQSLFTAIYGNLTSVKERENTFVDVSGSTNSGYIALLQMSIAARARCIVLIGGGSFQGHALNMYKDLHPQKQCIATSDVRCQISMQ